MTSRLEAIVAEVANRLQAIGGVQEFARDTSGDPTKFPALFLTQGPMEMRTLESGTQGYVLSLLVEGYVRGGDGATASAARNDLYAAAAAALLDNGQTLDGLVHHIEERRFRPSVAELSRERRMAFELELEIQFSTMRGNPALPA